MCTTFKQWLKENLDAEERRDLVRYGPQQGFPGLTSYTDTCRLYDKHTGEMWEALSNEIPYIDVEGPLGLLRTGSVWTDTQFKNEVVWVVALIYCREEGV